jgi:signal transduction histidine kinase/CheY-like chemotaxis protein
LLSANRALGEALGVEDLDDLVGSDGAGFLFPSNDREMADYFHQIKMEGEASGLARVVTATGETRLLRYHNTLRTHGVAEPLVRGLARDVTEQERARRGLLRQVEQEELISVIATRFISLDGLDLGPAIETGLGELGSFADVDWAGLFIVAEEGDEIVATHSWTREETPVSDAGGRSISEFGWLAQRLLQLETVVVPDTGELDEDAANNIRELLGENVQSALLVPLVSRHGLLGMLALVLRSSQRRWVQESLVLAYISSYVFASAVMRARHEERSLRLEKEVQQARKMESLGLVAGGIAHDFNNHLMGILGHAGFLREELTPGSDGWKALQLITDSAHRAARLTSQMLSFSGSAAIVPETLDLDDLLSGEVQRQRTALPEGVEMDLWLSGSLPPVRVDLGQIRQVVHNLILNAVEALGKGGGRVQVRSGVTHLSPETPANGFRPFERPPVQGTYVFVQVSDSGCGIESEDLTRIFDPFFSTRFKGRGLGLAAVHGIVRAHEGMIEVSSDPGSGTAVRVLLPSLEPVREVKAGRSIQAGAPVAEERRGAILIVDDEKSVIDVVSRMLEAYGFEVRTASNEQQVIESARASGSDVKAVLFDYSLPDGDPVETLREIRTSGLSAPVIMMSGYSRDRVIESLGSEGCAGFLEKPFGSQVLLSELERVLEQ